MLARRSCSRLPILVATIATLTIATPWAFGQQKEPIKKDKASKVVEPSLRLLTDMTIVSTTMDIEPLGNWVKPIIAGVEARFQAEKAHRDVSIQILLSKKGKSEVVVAGRPALSEAEAKEILGMVDLAKAPRTKIVDLSFRIDAKINGGNPDPAKAFEPKLVDPFDAFRERFTRSTTAEQVALLRDWARDQAIPVIAATTSGADPKFEGVVNLGKTLTKLDLDDLKGLDVEALTERNHDFWRATLEMGSGNMITPVARMALHCVKGDLDKARRFAEIAGFFDANKSVGSRLLGEFRTLHGIFTKDFEARINQGIALHDQGKLAEAIEVYDKALTDYPASAWATYERFHTRRTILTNQNKSIDEAHAGWPEAREAILDHDPLYATLALAHGREETFRVLRRVEIKSLFQDRKKFLSDVLSYADIARDLDAHGYSSMIYWNAFSRFPPAAQAGRNLLDDFLYGLERLDMKDFKDNFRGDHAAAFVQIEASRKKRIETGPAANVDDDPKPAPPKPDK